jgi:hypothetical protein
MNHRSLACNTHASRTAHRTLPALVIEKIMGEWTKVFSEPLGLTGFALFLIFGFIGKTKANDKRRWLTPVAFACAAFALIGGLGIAYLDMRSRTSPPKPQVVQQSPAPEAAPSAVQQESAGPDSPNINGVQGDVNLTIGQNTGAIVTKKTARPKPQPKRQQ